MVYEYTAYFDVSVIYFDDTDKIKECYYGWVLLKNKEVVDWKRGKIININTSSSGELVACSKLLKHILNNKDIKKIQIYGDCQTSIDALNNLYTPRGATVEYFKYTMSILRRIRSNKKKVKLTWIPRKFNKMADRLAHHGILEKYTIKYYKIKSEKSFAIFYYFDLVGFHNETPVKDSDAVPIKKNLTLETAIKLKKKMEEFKTFDEIEVWLAPKEPTHFHRMNF